MCERTPFPFPDKYFDYILCSQTLEDLRDPIWVCSELVRIGKRGYIEVPSRRLEMTRGVESLGYAGHYHHRWLIEIKDNLLLFRFKTCLLNESWRYHLPPRAFAQLPRADRVSYLFWEGTFYFREEITISYGEVQRELEAYVRRQGVYSPLRYRVSDLIRAVKRRMPRFQHWYRRWWRRA